MKVPEFFSSISPKGQITLPAEIRRSLGLKAKDVVAIELNDGAITVRPVGSRLLTHYQKAGSLREPLTWKEIEEIAHEEHTLRAAREGLDD
jgi:AbrB family looped-hinge helix DNA binding protein